MTAPILITDAHLACFSRLVYAPWPDVEFVVNFRGGENYTQWDEGGTQAFMAVFRGTIVVAFAGSAELVDWINNFDAVLERWYDGWGRVHRGFLRAMNFVANSVIEAVQKVYKAGMRLTFTGHSEGAAVATLVAAKFAQRHLGSCECVTFGSPRVGDIWFAARFDDERAITCRRYVNNNDIVAHFPPCFPWLKPGLRRTFPWVTLTYQPASAHVGQFLYNTNGRGVIVSPRFLTRLWWGIRGCLNHFGKWGVDAIRDHWIGHYDDALGGDRLRESVT